MNLGAYLEFNMIFKIVILWAVLVGKNDEFVKN